MYMGGTVSGLATLAYQGNADFILIVIFIDGRALLTCGEHASLVIWRVRKSLGV